MLNNQSSSANYSSSSLISISMLSVGIKSSSSIVEKVNDLWYLPNFFPPFLFNISLSHSSRFYSEKEDLMIEKSVLIGLIRITDGNPAFKEKISCNYWWSPAWAHIKLTGLSLKLLTTDRTISR